LELGNGENPMKIGGQVRNQVWDQVWDQVWSQVREDAK